MVLESWGAGGTETYVAQLGAWLMRRGARSTLCVLDGEANAATPWAASVHALGRRKGWKAPALARLLRELRPDVCHLHLYSSLLPAVLAARAGARVRLVTTLHIPLWQWSLRHRLAWRAAVSLSDAVTASSRASLRSVGRDPDGETTWLTPAPLHGALLGAATVPSHDSGRLRDDDSFLIVGAGRLATQKDWPTLLCAFARFRETAASATRPRLRLLGAGPLEGELRALSETLGIRDAVELPGAVPRDRLFAEVSAADVFVLPSLFEGLGMVAIEAMALGVPTITADFEASADFIEDGTTGLRFPRGDHEALAAHLQRCRDDPAEARAMGARGRAHVISRFAEDVAFEPFLAAYGWGGP